MKRKHMNLRRSLSPTKENYRSGITPMPRMPTTLGRDIKRQGYPPQIMATVVAELLRRPGKQKFGKFSTKGKSIT
jgi:hypothetical protein